MFKDTPILTLVCSRKHFLRDRKYTLTLTEDRLQMSDNEQLDDAPKYVVRLDHSNCIMWKFDASNQLIAFGIKYKDQVKWFHSEQQQLLSFKRALRCDIFQGNISLFYESVSLLGSGASCKVYKVRNMMTKEHFASKCIRREYIFQKKGDPDRYVKPTILRVKNRMIQEIQLIQSFNHPNIVNMVETYEGDNSYYIILELLEGLSLQQHLKKSQYAMTYDDIKQIMIQILEALAYLQRQGVMHRDLKPDNVVLKSAISNDVIKIVDFGLATFAGSEQVGVCGTPGYIAPEVFTYNETKQSMYDCKCDVFSAGAIMFKMATKRNLFAGKTAEEVLERNRKCLIDFQLLGPMQIPLDLLDLMQGMLQQNPRKRLSAREALAHRYFKQRSPSPSPKDYDRSDSQYFVAQEDPKVSVPQTQLIKGSFSHKRGNSPTDTDTERIYRLRDGIVEAYDHQRSYSPSFSGQDSLESFQSQNSSFKLFHMQKSDHILECTDKDDEVMSGWVNEECKR